jgi:hypothetical protein
MREDFKKFEVAFPARGLAPGQRWSAARKREVVLRGSVDYDGEPTEVATCGFGALKRRTAGDRDSATYSRMLTEGPDQTARPFFREPIRLPN